MFAKRVLIWSVVACFAVFFGVDLATRGIQEVHGPLTEAEDDAAAGSGVHGRATVADHPAVRSSQNVPAQRAAAEPRDPREQPGSTADVPEEGGRAAERIHPADLYPYLYESERGDTLVNKMADRTGSIVRKTANRGVDAFVFLFDAVVGSH